MVNVQYYCFLTNIITKTKICESETTFFNFVNLPKREKIPLNISLFPHCYLFFTYNGVVCDNDTLLFRIVQTKHTAF